MAAENTTLLDIMAKTLSISKQNVATTNISDILHWKALLPADITLLLSLTLLLTGMLCNVFLGLYVAGKLRQNSGLRVLLCNQILANLLALFSYIFIPIQALDEANPTWNFYQLCKALPSVGFIAVSVSIMNITAIMVSCYRAKRYGKTVSCGSSWIVVVISWLVGAAMTVPLTISLQAVETMVNGTMVKTCVVVWARKTSHDIYLNCVFIVKYAAPMLLLITSAIKMELLHVKTITRRCHEVADVLLSILAAVILLLLVYFFPLGYLGKGKFLSPTTATAHVADIVQVCELVALANCSTVPIILTIVVDAHKRSFSEIKFKVRKETPRSLEAEVKTEVMLPCDMSSVTYDALVDDMPEKWRPSPARVLIV